VSDLGGMRIIVLFGSRSTWDVWDARPAESLSGTDDGKLYAPTSAGPLSGDTEYMRRTMMAMYAIDIGELERTGERNPMLDSSSRKENVILIGRSMPRAGATSTAGPVCCLSS